MKKLLMIAMVLTLGMLWGKAQAQAVYKCSAQSYSEKPCSTRIVRTYDAPVDTPKYRTSEVVAHRLPGETSEELALRKRRIRLTGSDRDECARLDKKMPFERERIKNSPHQEEIDEAQDSLFEAKKRFKQLHC
ncbi:MAG TPA: hypothetical protein VMZ74_14080 [Ramlibacter sp.]|nr:hypothetical protein [Ramlibacter sp.]